MPNTLEGRAVAALLAGRAASAGKAAHISLDRAHLEQSTQVLDEMIALLSAIRAEIHATPPSPVLDALYAHGVDEPKASRLAADPWVTLDRIESLWDRVRRNSHGLKNWPGKLIRLLEAHQEPPQPEQTHYDDSADSSPPPELDEQAKQVIGWWQIAYGELQLQLPREAFDTWLRQARLLAHEDGTFLIGVQNVYAREWLEHRLKKVIVRTLSQVAGRSVDVRFVVFSDQDHQADLPS